MKYFFLKYTKQMQQILSNCNQEMVHCRLGHLSIKGIHTFQNLMSGINPDKKICIHHGYLPTYASKANNIRLHLRTWGKTMMEMMHFNICGAMQTTSMGDARYFVTFIDDISIKVWLYALKLKGKCFENSSNSRPLSRGNGGT